jgi:ectoine hydroxylase-related dioxygenase (phytanoyl-CoA dioxygenase family)
MPILNAEALSFFNEQGYVVARNVLPPENLRAVVDLTFSFLAMDPNNPDDWYREPHRTNGMVEVYQHQALWNNRQHPRMHQVFSEIYGTEKLWVSEDRVGFKPPQHPAHPEYDHKGFSHWDIDTSKLPQPFRVQGVLCLTDTSADMGGFQCALGFHKDLEAWIATQPADRNPFTPDLNALPPGVAIQPIEANAGDLIIWNTRLLHGNGHNVSKRPRLAQYITMMPADDANETARAERIERWQKRLSPPYKRAFPGDPRGVEEREYTTAELTPLGRKLLGLDRWL